MGPLKISLHCILLPPLPLLAQETLSTPAGWLYNATHHQMLLNDLYFNPQSCFFGSLSVGFFLRTIL